MISNPKAIVPATVQSVAHANKRFPFGFGRRFFLLISLGILWAIPAFWDARFLLLMAVWDVFAVVAWAVDLNHLAKPHQIAVQRSWGGAASLNNEVEVTLEIQNLSGASLECRILDDIPSALRSEPPDLLIRVGARNSGAASYTAKPLERGDINLAGSWLRYQSAAHFAERWAFADLGQRIRVFPDLELARKHNIYLSRARQIELEKRLIRQRGTGREFESLREYQPGDEFRDICWTATARRGKHVTKLYQVERSQAVWIVMDARATAADARRRTEQT